MKLYKKDGTIINAKIDTEDLKRVLDQGTWFAEWNKNFNNYLVRNLCDYNFEGKEYRVKLSLQTFIMNAHPKAPIKHCNGDTLDNRKCNLEIYNQNTVNDYRELDEEIIVVILRNKYGKEESRTVIDKEDLDRVINSGYTWVYYNSNEEPYAVANSPKGRIYLDKFIMNTPENMRTHHINLNTLDNRKVNLENKGSELVQPKLNIGTSDEESTTPGAGITHL